jgi:hypothetical protein
MSQPQRPGGEGEPTRAYQPVNRLPEQPPVVEPTPQAAAAEPAKPTGPKLDAGRYWAGAVATAVVCALVGVAASVLFDEVFEIGLVPPPDVLGLGEDISWAGAGAVFALVSAGVLHLLLVVAPSPRMFFGWLIGLATVILAVLPFANTDDLLAAAMSALVWVILGLAVWSLLTAVLSRSWRRAPAVG